MSTFIQDVFGSAGTLMQHLPDYAPRDGQIQLAEKIRDTIQRGGTLLAEAPCGCHVAGQRLLMFDGTTKAVEDIVVGDRLMGPDSQPRIVSQLIRGEDEIVKIDPKKGASWGVNLDHVLTLERKRPAKRPKRGIKRRDCRDGELIDVTVREWLTWTKTQKTIWWLFRSPVTFQPRTTALPIPPYFMGLLIGDGSLGGSSAAGSVGITNVDEEAVDQVYRYAEVSGMTVRVTDSNGRRAPTYYLKGDPKIRRNPLITKLRILGMYGHVADNKFIPHEYKTGSERERLELLAGLLDADAECDINTYAMSFASKQLADDVAFIARSLGFGATRHPVTKQCTNAKQPHAGTYHYVSIYGDTAKIPCNIPRRQAAPRRQIKSVLRTGFKVHRTGQRAPYYGFTLDGDGRYLLDDFTVTHNSGKTLAYAAPAIAHALATNTQVLIVTANKALQEQLGAKDLPLLQEALADLTGSFTFKVLKGRQNYLCQRELSLYDNGALSWPDGTQDEGAAISAWALIPTCTGEQSDAPIGISQRTWRAASVTGDECDRGACPHYENCFAEKALREADRANVIVANYDLFYSKLLYSGEDVWRQFGVVILDESHEAATLARRCFTRTISESMIRKLATTLGDQLYEHGLAKRLRAVASPFFERIANYASEVGARVEDPNFIDVTLMCDVLKMIAEASHGPCSADRVMSAIDPSLTTAPHNSTCILCTTRKQVEEKANELVKDLKAFVAQSDDSTAYWLEKPTDVAHLTGATVKLCAAPYHVGEKLRKLIFQRYPTVICVSATLTSGGSFDFVSNEFGLDQEGTLPVAVSTIRIPSPFDFKKQAKLIIPLGIPFPLQEHEELFDVAAAKAIMQLVHDCRGRLLALFTSWRRLHYVAEQLHNKIDYPLLVQGETSNNKDIARMFRQQTDSVLLATRSFWMGLDVTGESLSCLVIDKLPFESFADPFVDMMKTKHPDTYWDSYYVPRAAIALAQGAGRLIRSTTDVGVFVLLDQRIKTKRYGRTLLSSLPFVGFSQDLADAGRFLDAAQGRP